MPMALNRQPDPDAQHEARRHQAADHQREHDIVARKAPAERHRGHERDHHRDDRHHHCKLDRAIKGALDVAGPHLREQIDEPVQRQPLHRENQTASNILKRQDVDADHRAIERDNVEREKSGQHIEGPWPAAAAWRDRVLGRARVNHRDTLRHRAHWVISFRISTVRRIRETMTSSMTVRMIALAAAPGYCSTEMSS